MILFETCLCLHCIFQVSETLVMHLCSNDAISFLQNEICIHMVLLHSSTEKYSTVVEIGQTLQIFYSVSACY